MTIKTVHLFLYGHVQGVFFRASLRDIAQQQSVSGWVRNRRDHRVEAMLHGYAAGVDNVIAWAMVGPSGARVDRIDIEDGSGEFQGFEVLPTL